MNTYEYIVSLQCRQRVLVFTQVIKEAVKQNTCFVYTQKHVSKPISERYTDPGHDKFRRIVRMVSSWKPIVCGSGASCAAVCRVMNAVNTEAVRSLFSYDSLIHAVAGAVVRTPADSYTH